MTSPDVREQGGEGVDKGESERKDAAELLGLFENKFSIYTSIRKIKEKKNKRKK